MHLYVPQAGKPFPKTNFHQVADAVAFFDTECGIADALVNLRVGLWVKKLSGAVAK